MFRVLIGFLVFVLVVIVFMAILFSVPVILLGMEEQYQDPGWMLLLPPLFSLKFSAILMRSWGHSHCFSILFFAGLLLLGLAAICVIAEWPRINDPRVYDLLEWPTRRNFIVFERLLTIGIFEYTGVAFVGTALLHDCVYKKYV